MINSALSWRTLTLGLANPNGDSCSDPALVAKPKKSKTCFANIYLKLAHSGI